LEKKPEKEWGSRLRKGGKWAIRLEKKKEGEKDRYLEGGRVSRLQKKKQTIIKGGQEKGRRLIV